MVQKEIQVLLVKSHETKLGRPSRDRIILKCTSEKEAVKECIEFSYLRTGPNGGVCFEASHSIAARIPAPWTVAFGYSSMFVILGKCIRLTHSV